MRKTSNSIVSLWEREKIIATAFALLPRLPADKSFPSLARGKGMVETKRAPYHALLYSNCAFILFDLARMEC